MDIMATIVEVTGASYPTQYNSHAVLPMEGSSLARVFRNQTDVSRQIGFEHESTRGYIDGNWKLVTKNFASTDGQRPAGMLELYDRSVDPVESNNLADEQPALVQSQVLKWNAWATRVGVPAGRLLSQPVMSATWDGGLAGNAGWTQATNWDGDVLPVFNKFLDVVFNTPGAGNLTNAIGGDLAIRTLTFTTNAGDALKILTASSTANVTGQTLTFDANTGSAKLTVNTNVTGSFLIGMAEVGSIALTDDLVINHAGSGELQFDVPWNTGANSITLNVTGGGNVAFSGQSGGAFTNTVTLNSGWLRVGHNLAFGSAALVLNGGTLSDATGTHRIIGNAVTVGGDFTLGAARPAPDLNGTVDLGGAVRTITVSNSATINGVIGNGGLVKSGDSTLTLANTSSYTGPTIINAGVLELVNGGGLDVASSISIGANGTFQFNRTNNLGSFANQISGSGLLLKTNTGEFGLTGSNSFSGTVVIQQGKFAFSGAASENGAPSVSIAAGGTLSIGAGFLGGTCTIGNLTGAGNVDPIYGQGTAIRTLQVNQTTDATFSGALNDGTSGRVLGFAKSGAARLVLSGTNNYTGGTTIGAGTLLVNGSLSNTAVTVNGGATLGGSGIIRGAVSVQGGGTLAPGASIGTLTISNNLVLAGTTFVEVNANNGQRDFVQGVGNITYGGALVVTNLAGTLTNGQSFQLFSASGTKTGNFTSITPALTGGKAWSFNPTNGVLSVVQTVPANSRILRWSVSSTSSSLVFSLSWPPSHLGWVAQSNIVSLASPSAWFDIPGSSSGTNLTIIPSPGQTNVFYRLRSP
jgi:autotransporter-associated beta strand protein